MPIKAFTVEEANALIPTLESVVREIGGRMEIVRRNAERLQVLDLLWGEKVHERDNPDHGEALEFRRRIAELLGEIEMLIEEEIRDRGLRFPQGGLAQGLIDFPTTWQGRWVFLCWRLGESSIQAWHEIDGGFAGRQSLTEEQAMRMGRERVGE